jgi:serine kinase of HPr protein (carbohydrate metabolism regulator)
MSEYINGSPKAIEHFMEGAVRGMGFVLVKDGKRWIKERDQIDLEHNPSLYVKVYRYPKTQLEARFVYDLRSGRASCQFKPSLAEIMNALAMACVGEKAEW